MTAIFLYGPPAVGKLTTAKSISARTGFKVFHNHLIIDMVESVFEFGTDVFNHLTHSFWLDIVENAAKQNLNIILTYCYDEKRDLTMVEKMIKIVKENNGNFIITRLYCEKEELFKRVTGISRLEFNKSHTPEKLESVLNQYNYFQVIDLMEHLNIDTTHLLPDGVTDIILNKYEIEKEGNSNFPVTRHQGVQ